MQCLRAALRYVLRPFQNVCSNDNNREQSHAEKYDQPASDHKGLKTFFAAKQEAGNTDWKRESTQGTGRGLNFCKPADRGLRYDSIIERHQEEGDETNQIEMRVSGARVKS